MALSYNTTLRNARLDAIASQVGANGRLRIYDGVPPANVGAALSGNNLLADLPCGAAFAPAASGGVLSPNLPTTTNAALTGTASFYRVTTSGGAAVMQGLAATSGSDLNLNTTNIVAAGPVQVTSWSITEGNP